MKHFDLVLKTLILLLIWYNLSSLRAELIGILQSTYELKELDLDRKKFADFKKLLLAAL